VAGGAPDPENVSTFQMLDVRAGISVVLEIAVSLFLEH
jgi:hypothetical protein